MRIDEGMARKGRGGLEREGKKTGKPLRLKMYIHFLYIVHK